ncbi:phage portal protein [Gottfriedia luciferensis]|uniref:phage portal protein n=1 Tax=Gottfriedia luciferensis TaxID=178774 RepID=UPI000A002DC7|nr:phage portal protein [Gottfriedia luciferensis]
MGLIQQWREYRQFQRELRAPSIGGLEELLLQAGVSSDTITKEQALNIPAVSACIEIISDTVASLPIKLYQDLNGKVLEVLNDNRISLLNDETGDTLDSFQYKKALIEDYLLNGASYTYINRERNKIKSLHYVDNQRVSVVSNFDPIFKSNDILVNGATYRDFEFIKITRKTKDGATGRGILAENNKLLSVAYNSLDFEDMLVKTGGNKRGFLKAANKLVKEAMDQLKDAFRNLYKNNNTENLIVLNSGLEFQEASQSSVEMQLNENKKTNSAEICKLFVVPPSILDGTANDEVYNNWIKTCILPILIAFQTSLNKDLLLPSEKGLFYFAWDVKELLKGDVSKRYSAYSEAVAAGWISKNEIRYIEDLEPIEGLDIVTMSLGEVIYDIKSKKYFTPNTDSIVSSGMNKSTASEGGE